MPMPTPNPGEEREKFINRCAGNDMMNRDYPDTKQRVAVCHSQYRRKRGIKESLLARGYAETVAEESAARLT